MANRRPQPSGNGGRRMDFNRNDGRKNFGRSGVSPWQGGGPGGGLPNLLPLGGGSTEATLALASNIINLLQPRQNPVPSLLDMPIRRDFGPQMGRFDRGFVPNRMGNQGNFRRTGNYNRAGERINTNRKQFKPNDGPKQQPKSSPKKEADSKAKPVKESDNQEQNKEETTNQVEIKEEDIKKEPLRTRYDDINPQLLKCHICNKSMWDGRSFENHLSGRAHAIMMQKTAQSYALTADTMRQEFKIGTGYRRIHIHTASRTLPKVWHPGPPPPPHTFPWAWGPQTGPRDIREMKRNRRSGQQPARDFYCAMCDMYASDGAMHRTTVGHRKLKKYLHPTCTSCHKEMPTRIELDEHRLTAEHLRNMQDKQEVVTKPKPEVMVISTLSMEQSYLRDDRQRKRRYDNQDDKQDDEQHDNKDEGGNKDGDDTQEATVKTEPGTEEDKNKKSDTPSQDNENTILDYKEGDDLSHVTADMIPVYSTSRGVGESFLAEFRCVQCRLCHKLLDSEETAHVHLRTWKHHQLFVKSLAPPTTPQETGGSAPAKRPHGEEEGNWKRRRTDGQTDTNNEEDDNLDNEQNGDVSMKDEPQESAEDANNAPLPPDSELEQMEDWEQSIDEILDDEKDEPEPEPEAEPEAAPEPVKEPEPVKQPEPVKPATPAPAPVKPATPAPKPATAAPVATPSTPRGDSYRGSPRTRGRGRGRGRGRY